MYLTMRSQATLCVGMTVVNISIVLTLPVEVALLRIWHDMT